MALALLGKREIESMDCGVWIEELVQRYERTSCTSAGNMTHDTRDTGDVTSISTGMTPPPAGRGLLLHQTSGGNTVQISRLSSR